jgi:outer membrane autotransporter protein
VDVTSGNLVFGDGLKDILVATTLNSDGTFAVTDNSFLFNFSAALDGDTIDLTVEQGADIVQIVQNADNSPAFGAAVVLSQLFESFSDGEDVGDFEAVIVALSTLTTEEQLNDAVSQVLPVVSAGGGTALAGAAGRAANIIQSRVGGSGLSGGDGYFEDRHFWAKLHGSWIDQDDRKGISGYDGDAKGFVFGADGELASGTRLGAALSFARTDIDGNSAVAPQTTEVETWELTGYGSYRIDPQMSFDFQLALGHGNAEGARTIAFMPGSPVARSDYDSLSFRASGALSRAYAMGGNTEIVPSIRADYTLVKTDDYTETGAGALNLNVASDTTKAFIVGLDATVNHRANETTVLTANAGVGYDLLDEDASVTSSFAGGGAAFSTPGIDSERIVGRLGVGVNVQASEGLTFSARYDLEAREDFSNQTGSLRMRWKF